MSFVLRPATGLLKYRSLVVTCQESQRRIVVTAVVSKFTRKAPVSDTFEKNTNRCSMEVARANLWLRSSPNRISAEVFAIGDRYLVGERDEGKSEKDERAGGSHDELLKDFLQLTPLGQTIEPGRERICPTKRPAQLAA